LLARSTLGTTRKLSPVTTNTMLGEDFLLTTNCKNMKLELKHWAAYIPYGIPAILSQKGIFNQDDEYPNPKTKMLGVIKNISFWHPEITGQLHITETYSFDFDDVDEVCICLHPLSDLIKEIEVNGEKFIPIERLRSEFSNIYFEIGILNSLVIKGKNENFIIYSSTVLINEKLCEWHFDVFGLIDSGLAIDINTVKF